MNQATLSRTPAQKLRRNLLLFLPALVLFAALTGFSLWRFTLAGRPLLSPKGMPLSPEIEERFGVRFTGVHIIGRGGLVDLRYRVIDAGKAKNFGHYTETSPLIIDEESGKFIEVTIMGLHNHRVESGRTYYILYRNTGDTLHPGHLVTIQVGDLSLAHVKAQ